MNTTCEQQLHQAASDGQLSGVILALAEGADVNAPDPYGNTALNLAAEYGHAQVVEYLLQAGAELENVGAAGKTPLMNAAFAGRLEVLQILLDQGARISDDLLSTVQFKVNILEENAESGMVQPEAVAVWKQFLGVLVTAQIRQNLPAIVADLSREQAEELEAALKRLEAAADRGIDVSTAVPQLSRLISHKNADTRFTASAILTGHYLRQREWYRLRHLIDQGDLDVKTGAVSALVSAARGGVSLLPILDTVLALLEENSLDLRHDAAVILGYLATNKMDVSPALPALTALLGDAEAEAREMAAWALYRVAKYAGSIASAMPALQAATEDPSQSVRQMAGEAVEMGRWRQQHPKNA